MLTRSREGQHSRPCRARMVPRVWRYLLIAGVGLMLGGGPLHLYAADSTPPVISCPSNIIAYASPGQCAKVIAFMATATDAVDPAPVVTCNPASGASFLVGSNRVTCTARDASGNTSACGFNILLYPAEVAPPLQWQQSFGGGLEDYLLACQQTSDGGYILGGASYSDTGGNKSISTYGSGDFWVLRLNASGIKIWEQTLGGSGDDVLYSLQQTSDGGFILAGMSNSGADGSKTSPNYGGYDFWVVRLDASGNQLWDQSFGGTDNDGTSSVSVRQTSDGGYIVGGDSRSGVSGSKTSAAYGGADYWILRLDANGNELWEQSFGGTSEDRLAALRQTADGGFILAGSSASSTNGNKTSVNYGGFDFWAVRVDDNGNRLWERDVGGAGSDQLFGLQLTSDGGFILGGSSSSTPGGTKTAGSFGSADYWLVRLDLFGNKVWDTTFGGNGDDRLNSVQQTTDGGFILGGSSASVASGNKTSEALGGYDYWVVRVDGTGSKLWEQSFGGTGSDECRALSRTLDGGYLVAGFSSSLPGGTKTNSNYGGPDYWAIKLAAQIPSISVPTGIVAECTGPTGALVSFSAVASNSCQSSVSIICTPASGSLFPLGVTSVSCAAVDFVGLTNQRSFTVVVKDTTPPDLVCPGNVTANADPGLCTVKDVSLGVASASDACSVVLITSNAPVRFNLGTNTVVWTATDFSGNRRSCTQIVAVVDIQGPGITCPSNITATASLGECGTTVSFSVVATDNCAGSPAITCLPPSGSLFQVGRTNVACVARDVKSNTTACAFPVLVYPAPAPPAVQWQQSFGGSDDEFLQTLQQTSDGGYILGGSSASAPGGNKSSPNYGGSDCYVVRLDASGKKLWEQTFGGSDYDALTSLQQTSDGGFLLGGVSASGAGGLKTSPGFGGYDFWIIRVDASGNKLWDRSFGGQDNDWLYSVQQTADGGFILGGWSLSAPSGNKLSPNYGGADYWIVRLDQSGNKLWEQSFGGSAYDNLYSLQQTSDGGFLLGGSSASGPGGNKTTVNYGNNDYWLLRLDANGTKLWEQAYGGTGQDVLFSAQEVADHGFILGGYSSSVPSGNKTSTNYLDNDYWILRLNSAGTKLWERSFGGAGTDGFPPNPRVRQTRDGGFLVGGQSASAPGGNKTSANYGGYDFWLVRLDGNGTRLWDQSLGGTGYDALTALQQTSDGGFIIGGQSRSDPGGNKTSPNYGNADFWILKLAGSGATFLGATNRLVDAASPGGAAVTFNVTATNYCLPDIPVSCVPPSGATFLPGVTGVNCIATDSLGNSNTVGFSVTVCPAGPPTVIWPSNLVVRTAPGFCYAYNVNLGLPGISNDCHLVNITNNAPSQFPAGVTTVTWTVLDDAAHSLFGTQTVTVLDLEPPVIGNCQNLVYATDPGACGAVIRWSPPSTMDNCGLATVTSNRRPGDFFPPGSTTVTYVVTDTSGNTNSCSFSVTIVDTEAPRLNCPGNILASTDLGQCTKSNVAFVVTATDNCAIATNVACIPPPGSSFAVGQRTVTCIASDNSGNIGSCSFTVTIRELQPPTITGCPTNRVLALGSNCTLAVPNLTTELVAVDNCGGAIVVAQNPPTTATMSLGTNLVTLTAADASGNTVTCQAQVIVKGNPPTARADTLAVLQDTALTIAPSQLLTNDVHSDGRPVQSVAGVARFSSNGGFILFDGTTLTYVPPPDYFGPDSFIYTNVDCAGLTASGMVFVDVRPDGRDTDGDGLPDFWEVANGLDPFDPSDARNDLDADGMTNLAEYLAGTDPNDPRSSLKLDACESGPTAFVTFLAAANTACTVQHADRAGGAWKNLSTLPAMPSNHLGTVVAPASTSSCFYRLIAPEGAPAGMKVQSLSVTFAARLSFHAVSNRAYTIEFTDDLGSQDWRRLSSVPGLPLSRAVILADPNPPTARFYRIKLE